LEITGQVKQEEKERKTRIIDGCFVSTLWTSDCIPASIEKKKERKKKNKTIGDINSTKKKLFFFFFKCHVLSKLFCA